MKHKWTWRALALVMIAGLGHLGCADSTGPVPGFPERLELLTTADRLTGAPGHRAADSVRVRLVSSDGAPIAGMQVTFDVTAGGGSVDPAQTTTDSAGHAATEWMLGPVEGEQTLAARVDDAEVAALTIRGHAEWGPARALEMVSGLPDTLFPGGCMPEEAVTVLVRDEAGQPVAGALVEFVPAEGSGSVSDAIATTDASGHARTRWTLGLSGGTNQLSARLQHPDAEPVTFTARSVAAAPDGLVTIGNQILDARTCAPHRILGIARPSLEWSAWGDQNFENVGQDFTNMRSWGANTVRIPLNQSFWLTGTTQHEPTYAQRIRETVDMARAAGLDVILDLHVSDRGDAEFDEESDVQQMADVNHSIRFWQEVASEFKDDGRVMFELYNEPHDIDWDLWLNGGTVAAGPKYPGGPHAEAFEAAGMQDLYDAVRSTGANNLVLVGGTHWGYFLDGVPDHEVDGFNIAYSTHPYDWPDKQPDTWETAWGFLAEEHPVVISEFGAYACDRLDYYHALLDYADQRGMSWVAWAWWTPPPVSADYTAAQRLEDICLFPALISDWNGTPSASGQLIRQRLQQAGAP